MIGADDSTMPSECVNLGRVPTALHSAADMIMPASQSCWAGVVSLHPVTAAVAHLHLLELLWVQGPWGCVTLASI